ncbi:MAG: TraX family protein [Lachnospiraceae bacterium]|nr:TraX family protein [Lachnospiraceae bacterium]
MMAIITMAIDHVGAVFFPQYIILRIIGRLAFPIFCFLLVEGFYHTRDVHKYMLRLGIFAFVSEIPFDLAFFGTFIEFTHQNVFFTLFLGLLALYLLNTKMLLVTKTVGVFLLMFLAELLHTDYGAIGILMILVFYSFREKLIIKSASIGIINMLLVGGVQAYATFSVIPILLYNGRRGYNLKYIFYAFYPVHLIIIFIVSLLL